MSDIQSEKQIFIEFTVDTNFQDCVYINFKLLVQVCLVQKKLLLVISVSSFLPIVILKLLSKFQLLSLKMKILSKFI